MQVDRQIAIWGGWIAGPAFGVAMMAAPEFLHLKATASAWFFSGGMIVFAVTIFVVAALSRLEQKKGHRAMWPIAAMAVGMVIFGVGVAGYFWPTHEEKEATSSQEESAFSWRWELLTAEEILRILTQLQATKPSQIVISCDSPNCQGFSQNFRDLFQKLNWPVTSSRGPALSFGKGITGITIAGNEETGNLIKKAIEAGRSTIPVSIGSPSRLLQIGPETIIFIIGSKPPPSPIPEALKAQLAEIGRDVKAFSARIMEFAEDRATAERLLPSRGSYGYDDLNALSKMFDRRREFSNETRSKFSSRFGSGVKVYVSKLSELGIYIPFHVQNAESEPVRFGKWFGAMGELLEQGQIVEARRASADDNLWFAN